MDLLSASTLEHNHVIILVFVGGSVIVLKVKEGDGSQLGGDTAGARAAIWVNRIHQCLHDSMFCWGQV